MAERVAKDGGDGRLVLVGRVETVALEAPVRSSGVSSTSARRWLLVAALLVLAAAVRICVRFYDEIAGDDATVALMARHFLSGEAFPVFFYRQAYMGSLNGLHLVPALFLFGASVSVVQLNAVAFSLLMPLLLYVLGRRLFDEPTARVALVLAALPPFLLTKWSTVAEPHLETNFFALALLLLALAALEADPAGPRYARVLVVFGFTAGLAWWTNFKALEVIGPAGLVLLLRDPWLPLRRAGLLLAGAALAGSLPVWAFYAAGAHGDAPARATQLFQPGLWYSADRLLELVTTVIPTLLGTYYWSADTWPRTLALWGNIAVYLLGSAALVDEALRCRRRGGRPDAHEWGRWLLLLALVTPFALLYVSTFVQRLDHESSRYVLPVYIPLFLGAAALVVRLGRRSRPAGALLLAGLLAFNVWTSARFLWRFDPPEREQRAGHIAVRAAIERHLAANPVEALYTDDEFASLVWAFHLPRLAVSELTSEFYPPHARAADAAERVAILVRRDRQRVTDALAALGATYRATRFPGRLLLDDIRVRAEAVRLVPRAGWRLPGAPAEPPALADGDLATAAPTGAAAATEVVVDLGAAYRVGRLVWWPATVWDETPAVAVAGSLDGLAWRPLGSVPRRRVAFVAGGRPSFRPRNAWLELRPEPRSTRFLRFAPAGVPPGQGWGVAELFVYEAADAVAVAAPVPTDLVIARLRDHGVTRLLADPTTSARVARATAGEVRTLTANLFLDSHGRYLPPARLFEPVELRATDGLLVPVEDAEDVGARLADAGLGFRTEAIGEHVLVSGVVPLVPSLRCRQTAWRLAREGPASPDGEARYVVEARLDRRARLVALHLEHPDVSVRRVAVPAVSVSDDGRTWTPVPDVRRLPEWAWAGRTLLRLSGEAQDLLLPATATRHVRLALSLPAGAERPVSRVCARVELLPG